jgi:RND family efflux transporter MFP subunit
MNQRPSLDSLKIDRSRPVHHSRWPLWTGLCVILLCGAAAAAWAYWPASGIKVHVAMAAADAGSASSALDASGYVVPRREATISAKISGKLVEANLEEGEHVAAGQVVARLDDSNSRAALATTVAQERQAEAAFANAAASYDRYRRAHDAGAISDDALQNQKTLYDSTRLALDVAKAAEAQAQTNLNDTVVHAPFAGIVTNKVAQAGDFVAPAAGGGGGGALTGIAHIVDMDSLEVDVDVSENYIDRVEQGQKATITLNAYPDWEIPASVIAVIPTADQSKGTVKVRVAIGTKDKRILPQMGARVSFLSDPKLASVPATHGVTVPAVAVQGTGENASVFVVKDDSTIETRPVTTGAKSGANIAVRGGLAAGERVVVDNFSDLHDGVKVAVQE